MKTTTPTIWMAARRRGLAAHRVLSTGAMTACGRSVRTGITLTAMEARTAGASWCKRCWLGGQPEMPPVDPHRAALAKGIRQLADWLEGNPDVPVHDISAHFCVGLKSTTDEEGLAELRQLADAANREVIDEVGTHPHVAVAFGAHISYKATYIRKEAMARYNALSTYQDSVTPDGAA